MPIRPLSRLVPVATLLVATILTHPAQAAWPHDPMVNVPVKAGATVKSAVADGSGGVFIISESSSGIRASHLLASGANDAGFLTQVLVGPAQYGAVAAAASDGTGGAFVAVCSRGSSNNFVVVQRVLPSGAAAWATPVPIESSPNNVEPHIRIVPDGLGAAFVAYQPGGSVRIVHVSASGSLGTLQTLTSSAIFATEEVAADGLGSCVVAWEASNSTFGVLDAYAAHVDGSGNINWSLLVAPSGSSKNNVDVVGDGAGGAIVAFTNTLGPGPINNDVYAQHILGTGVLDPNWGGSTGRAVCNTSDNTGFSQLVSDASGGAIVLWRVAAGLASQHISADGQVDSSTPDGHSIVSSINAGDPVLSEDGVGGAFVAWPDNRTSSSYASLRDIYGQHLLPSGAPDPAWTAGGRLLCGATNEQADAAIVSDRSGGAIVAWSDLRSGNSDIYAQRVGPYGYLGTPEPVIASVADVPNDNGGKVKLSWDASYPDYEAGNIVTNYWLFRSVPPNRDGAAIALQPGADPRATAARVSSCVASGRPAARLATPSAAGTIYWEYVSSLPALHILEGYSALVPTTGDSLDTGAFNLKSRFMVVAINADTSIAWLSAPDSGYSVDNLPPGAPAAAAAQIQNGTLRLKWAPNTEPDVKTYRIYRGDAADFSPSAGNLAGEVDASAFSERASGYAFYKVTAVDRHLNESPATLTHVDGAAGPHLSGLALALPVPSPARSSATFAWSLPSRGPVQLRIFDLAGRTVTTLEAGVREPGQYSATWSLSSDGGKSVPGGLYFARLEFGGRSLQQRLVVVR